MPSTRIETRKGWLGDRRAEFLEAVQQALVDGLLIPDRDRDIRLTQQIPRISCCPRAPVLAVQPSRSPVDV